MSSNVNPDLKRERANASFDVDKLTYIIDGGQKNTEHRRRIEQFVIKNTEPTGSKNYHYLSRPEQYREAVRKAGLFFKMANEQDLLRNDDEFWPTLQSMYPNEVPPFIVHEGMFIPMLESQCTPEQEAKWLQRAKRHEILGTYVQTEMGHGTHIRQLETTARYDPKTEEFIINSPTISSTKWWPGGLGHTSDHIVLIAQLFTQGKNLGIHSFIVQIRDLNTHKPLPGITVGDIGPKFGYQSMDNGFLRFDHVRIPRDQMLMKNNEVLKDGTFVTKTKNMHATYGTMIMVRATIVLDMARHLAQACTIATRYSCVRRQSELTPGAEEPQILDFQTQQYKVLPMLGAAYAYIFAGKQVMETYAGINEQIKKGNIELLPELHATVACLKSFASYGANKGIEQCRLACGGHGYSHASGIPKIYVIATPGCTYEGENTVMYLQTARYLIKAYEKVASGKNLTGLTSYLQIPKNARCTLRDDLQLNDLLNVYKYRAARMVEKAGMKYTTLRAKEEQHIAWNNSASDLVNAAEAHASLYILEAFLNVINGIDDEGVRHTMTELCQLYACHELSNYLYIFIENGYMSGSQIELVKEAEMGLLAKVRSNGLPLADAFDFPDHHLGSCLGRYDGRVYETLFEWAKASPLNETEVHPSFDKYVKPFRQQMKDSKL